jgi:hypothetical protein
MVKATFAIETAWTTAERTRRGQFFGKAAFVGRSRTTIVGSTR